MKKTYLSVLLATLSLSAFSQVYYGLFEENLPTNNTRLTSIETELGKKPGLCLLFMSSKNSIPVTGCNNLVSKGITPIITLEPALTYTSIINGDHDAYWRTIAGQLKQINGTVFLRYAHEMNGDWYTWDGSHNGANATASANYILAWRHVYDNINKEQGVTNVLWNWCVNGGSWPKQSWNEHMAYYPGDAYVDWIGFDSYDKPYNYTPTRYQTVEQTFREAYDAITATTKDKPVLIGEFASENSGQETDPHKADFFSQGNILFENFGRVHGFSYFNVAKNNSGRWNNYMINNPVELLPIFKTNWIDNANVANGNTGIAEIHKYKLLSGNSALKIESENYFDQNGIKNQACDEGGLNAGFVSTGDYMDYLIEVASAGLYTLNIRVASAVTTGKLELRNESGAILATFSQTTSTGGWQIWKTQTVNNVNLTAGKQKLRIYFSGAGLNLNWFEIKKNQVSPVISFTNLVNNQEIAYGTDLNINVSATHPSGIDSVKLYVDNVFLRKETQATYDWGLGTNDPILNTLATGQHTIKAIATATSGEVGETSIVITIVKIVTDLEEKLEESFSLYPNPVKDILHLSEKVQWELYSATGVKIETGNGDTISLVSYPKGFYILKIQDKTHKIIKE